MSTTFEESATHINSFKAQLNPPSISQEGLQTSSNPFTSKISLNPFSLSASSFLPTEFVPKQPLPAEFVPFAKIQDSEADESAAEQETSAKRFKTELCKNWIENGSCRYGKKCQFAHGQEELRINCA